LIEMMGDADGDDADGDDADGDAECEPCEPTEHELAAAAYFEQVQQELAWTDPSSPPPLPPLAVLKSTYNGCAGGLVLYKSHLLWGAMGTHCETGLQPSPYRAPSLNPREP